jgi:hypothetical protein
VKPKQSPTDWPMLNWADWRETAQHLHLMTQIVGKVRLALTPWLNHGWHVPLYVTARGFGTSPITLEDRLLEIDFDFLRGELVMTISDGSREVVALLPGSIASFHAAVISALEGLHVPAGFDGKPSEIPDALPFAEDHAQRPYDAESVQRFWRALIITDGVFKGFRTGFLGKASPTHFFWGSFDLASTRFSGRIAPRHSGGVPGLPDAVTCEAYSHEESSLGFWPGSDAYPHAAFYAYAYPAPDGYALAAVEPSSAHFSAELGEFILSYDDVRSSSDPRRALLAFCQSTYDVAADLGNWDRGALECPLGVPRQPRKV